MCIDDENVDTGPAAGKKLQKGTARKEKKERTKRERERKDRDMMTMEMFDFVAKEVITMKFCHDATYALY